MAQTVQLGRGMTFLRQQQEKMGSSSFGSGYKKLWLSDGDTAMFWFVTDLDEVVVPLVHGATMTSKKGKTFNIDVLCPKPDMESPCPLGDRCISGELNEEGKYKYPGPFPRPVFYVWVDKIYHSRPDPDGKWTKVSSGNNVLYREDVGSVYLLIAKQKMQEQIEAAWGGDPTDPSFDTRTPTLKDQQYKIRVTGQRQQRQDILSGVGERVGELPVEVTAAAASLPSLEETVVKEFGHQLTDTLPGRSSAPSAQGGGRQNDDDSDIEVDDSITDEDVEPIKF